MEQTLIKKILIRSVKFSIYIFLIFGLLVATFIFIANTITFGDFDDVEEKSLPVYFYVSDDLKKIPVFAPSGKIYYSSDDELFEQGFHAKYYLSYEKIDIAFHKYKNHFIKNKCLKIDAKEKGKYYLKFKCKEIKYSISLVDSNNLLDVFISKKIYR